MAEYPGKPVNLGGTAVNLPEYTPVDPSSFTGGKGGTVGKLTADEMIANIRTTPVELSNVPATALPLTGRFNNAMPYTDTEEMAGQQQSSWDKWGNGLAKMTGTAGTTFLNGTVGTLVGIGSWIKDGRFASLYDNEFNRNLDEFNKRMEDYLPNYYTHLEQDATWYSSQNILTANFWSDKVVKNLGFSVGALAGGFAWGAMFKAIGLTNKLVQAGKGLETITAVDKAISTAPAAGRFGAIAETLTGLSSTLKSGASTVLSNADRTLVSVMGTMGEASVEALQNMNQFRDNLINEYINRNGIKPEGDDLEEINTYADKVGNFTWGMNVALLSATNYIQLPKILNTSKTAEKRMINEVIKEEAQKGATLAEKAAVKYKAAPGFLEETLGRPGRLLNNIIVRPASLAFAPIEAFEEGAQFAAQIGVNDYFNRAYKNQEDVTSFFKNTLEAFDNILGEGVTEALTTKEGLESILIGGISGGIQTSFSPFGQSRIKQEGFTGQGGVQGKNTQLALDALNKSKNLSAVLKDAVKYASIAISTQKARQGYVVSGDTLQEKDYEKDYTLAYVMPRVKYGKIDSIKEEISLYKNQAMTEKGFEDLKSSGVVLPNETREKFLKRLTSIENTASKVAETYEMVNDKYSALVNDAGELAYTPEVIDKLVYATAKILDYDQRAAELSNSLSLRGVTSYSVMEDVLEGKKESYLEQVKVINDNTKLTSDQKTALKEDLADLADLALRRKEYLKQYEEVKKNPNNFKDTPTVIKKKDAEGKTVETVSIKTKKGEKDIEIGTTYILGRVVEKDAKGNDVFRAPEITILGENEDGTIKVKASNGNIRDIKKSELEKYNLAKLEDVKKNKTANFFRNHWNTIYEFNFGKGKKKPGRLVYYPEDNKLTFAYNENGKTKEITLNNKHFEAQPGFKNAILTPLGELTLAQKQSQKEYIEEPTVYSSEREDNLKSLIELFDELINKQDRIKQLIKQKQNQVKDIIEELASLEESVKTAEFDARSKKALRFKSQTKKALEAAITLSRMKDQLEKEIESLQTDEQELEFNASYVADLAQNIDELPTNSDEFLEELKEQKALLESAILETGKNINTISNLIDKVQDALTSAIKLVLDNISRFEKKYPEVPRDLDQKWIDFLQQNPKLPETFKKEEYKQALREINEFVSQVEDLDIAPNERTLGELKEELVSLQKSLEQTEKEFKAKDAILAKFEEIAEKHKQQKAEEDRLVNNQALRQKFLGTHSSENQNNFDKRPYQPEKKKDNNSLLNGTVGRFKVGSREKPHEIRANTFGINFHNLKNKAKLRAIEITAKTEALAGIPGLIDSLILDYNTQAELKGKATISKDTVVATIFVQDEGNGKFSFVDENGKVVTEDLINTAIYQVRPTEKLVQDYSAAQDGSQFETSFRDTTSKADQEELRVKYKADRDRILASESLEPMKSFSPSFGILLYEQKDQDGKSVTDWDAQNPVASTGLVSEDDLSDKSVLKVATTNDIIGEGKTFFRDALGRVFLSIPGVGMFKLNNSKLGRKRAEAVYQAILQLAKNAQADPENGVKNSEPILNWLKSVVYWGIQHKLQTNERKEPSYNSIWFEDTAEGTRLFISAKDQNFTFTPSKLEASKEAIITILEATYHNTSNKMLSEPIDKKYTEYVGVDKEGKLIPGKTWDNYQSYLLSSEGRKGEEIPLTTPALAIKGTQKVNREGIYFVLENNLDAEIAQKKAPEPKKEIKVVEGMQVYTSPEGKKINYLIEGGEVVLKPGGDLAEIMAKLKPAAIASNPGKTSEEVKVLVVASIQKRIQDSLPKEQPKKKSIFGRSAPKEKVEEDEPATTPTIITTEKVDESGKKESKVFTSTGKKSIFGRKALKRLELYSKPSIFEKENWADLDKWLKANFPNLPVYRVKNIIKATNGRQAWGMLHNGAIYLYENAQIGTAYHEVFEAVWAMATDVSERNEILKEFKNREGAFKDRFTGKTLKYSEATDEESKEEIAEEFRDYILEKKIPVKPKSGKPWLLKLFSDLVDLFKTFFTGPESTTNTGKLFKKIGSGYYKTFIPYESNLSFAKEGFISEEFATGDESSVFRITNLPYTQQHELMQEMTYSTLAEIVGNNDSLFNIGDINKTILYERLKEEILSKEEENPGILFRAFAALENDYNEKRISTDSYNKDLEKLEILYSLIESNWDKVVEEHIIYLKQYSIEFDENDNLSLNREEETKENQYENARKTDSFRKANSAIKLLLATLPKVKLSGNQVIPIETSIGGVSTIPLDKAFITLKNRLYDSLDIKNMMEKLRDLANEDINYRILYTRLTKNDPSEENVSFSKLTEKHDIDLLSAFYKTMKAQNADVKIVYILPSGEIEIGDAHLASATRQVKSEMFSELVSSLKGGHKYLNFNKKDRTYEASKLVKSVKLNPSKADTYLSFLKELGIDFSINEWNTLERKGQLGLFKKAVEGTLLGIQALSEIKDINKYTVGQEKTLRQLGALKASLTNPDFESTYFNISGERTQTYIGTNVLSDFFQTISSITNLKKEIGNTPYKWLLTDPFAQGSLILNSVFNPKTGTKREGKEDIFSVGIVEGIVEESKGKSTESSNFTSKQRLIQDLNNNYNGWFMNLVPGDASIEWMIKLFSEGNPFVKASDLQNDYTDENIFNIFKDYFIAEVNTSRSDRPIVEVEGRNPKDLRFFKGILKNEKLHKAIISNTKDTAEKIYNDNKVAIKKAVKDYISNKAENRLKELYSFNIIKVTEEGFQVEGLEFAQKEMTLEKLKYELEALEANFIIANIELHKLIYSDPYFYKDELKRTKNFGSPAQPLMDNPEVNAIMHEIFNKEFKKNKPGWTDFTKNYLISATLDDIKSFIKGVKGYENWKETDGGGFIMEQANRVLRLKAASWNDSNEKQFLHDMKYYEMYMGGATLKELYAFDDKNNPGIKSTYTPIKPIVRGSKEDGNPYNDIVLDKFALTPLSFRILHRLDPKSNAIKHYQRMLDTEVDYTVFESGRKVGSVYPNSLYEPEGVYATSPFLGTSNIPFSIISIQTEVPSKDKPEVTQGSQMTVLSTVDFMDSGVPIDFKPEIKDIDKRIEEWSKLKTESEKEIKSPLYKLIKHNDDLLIERIKVGYLTLLDKLGLEFKTLNEKKYFSIKDKQKLVDTLTSEIYKREVNDNIIEAFKGFKEGAVVLEATPAYQQIRNILYSIANKQVTRQTVSGGMKVQVTSTLLESVRAKEEEVNGKMGYTSDILKFYEDKDGERVCEIMVGRWFKSDKTDAELLKYFNDPDNKEAQKILRGIAYRIPTQKQNSIDVFKIKKFLPNEFGDSVIIPSALVQKAGSDFDIDKLSIYLKNVYEDLKGNIKLIPFLGYGEKAKAELAEMCNEGEFLSKETKDLVHKYIKNRKKEDLTVFSSINRDEVTERLFDNMFGGNQFEDSYIIEVLDDILDSDSEQELRKKIIDQVYKKSIENEYIQSLEDLTSHPLNYDKLTSPNSAEQLKDLSKKIVNKLSPGNQIDYTSVDNMLDRSFMERLRQAFVKGKYAIGIAATAQTNNAKNQRSNIIVDIEKLASQSEADKKWLGDGIIKFQEFNKVGGKPSLSLSRNTVGQLISDIIGQFIDGYVDISKGPWIMELGATPNTAGTWLFLVKLGVPVDTVAYFMNQPIILDHIKNLENSGYSYLFNSTASEQAEFMYKSEMVINKRELPSSGELEKMVGKKVEDMSAKEKALQGFIFEEFFKYAKLAEQLFHVQQGSNFDTANINDPFIVFKKKMQYEKAKTMMISSVDDLLNNSFVGALKDTIFDIRDAFSTILISDRGSVRNVIEKVLLPYIDTPDRDFVKTSQKAVNDLFDWAMQTNEGFNSKIKAILLGSDDRASAAQEIMSFVKEVKNDEDHPLHGNYIINSLKQEMSSVKENKPHNLYITGKNNKTYDQNSAVYGFSEIRDYLKNQDNLALYEKLVALSVLQSGLSNSKISFTQLLPYEDFRDVYNPALQNLEKIPNLQQFADLDIFQRNNWNNTDVVYGSKSRTIKSKKGNWVSNMPMIFVDKKLQKEIKNGKLPQIIQFSPFTPEGNKNFISYTWELDQELLKGYEKEESYKVQKAIAWARKKEMKKRGDYSYIKRGLFKKVLDAKGNPVVYESEYQGVTYTSYMFRAINAWGDSFRANEFYSLPRPSVIDNNFIKAEETIQQPGTQNPTDAIIEKIINMGIANVKTNEFEKLPFKTVKNLTYAGVGSRETPKEVLDEMSKVAKELEKKGYTLRTGDADGADKAFRTSSNRKEVYTAKDATTKTKAIANEVHPNPSALSDYALNLMARNTNQVFGKNLDSPVDFVLFWAKETSNPLRPAGGTGQAVEMARRKGVPTVNMASPDWKKQLDQAMSSKPSRPMDFNKEELLEDYSQKTGLTIGTTKLPGCHK